jgi:hypothetical protein
VGVVESFSRKGRREPMEKLHRLTNGSLSIVCNSNDLDHLLSEIDEVKKAIKRAKEEGWDFPTLARVLRVSVPA